MLSYPVRSCVYLDRLLCKLQAAGSGYRIFYLFAGVLAYADGIALPAPTVHAMRYMLKLSDDYANMCSFTNNTTKFEIVIVCSYY